MGSNLSFKEFIKQYSKEELENNFESIVSEFLFFEYSEFKKQGRYSWVFSIPNKITGVKFIPFEEFKEKINETLNIPGAEQKEVLKRFKNEYITKALEIDKFQRAYINYKSGKQEMQIFSSLMDKFSFYAQKCTVVELIKLERYLNECENSQNESLIKLPENNFDGVDINEVYRHFKTNLVDKKRLAEPVLMEFLKTAFELQKPPTNKFKLEYRTKKEIQKVFYSYYNIIAGSPHGEAEKYLNLLKGYFVGFEKLSTSNFSKIY